MAGRSFRYSPLPRLEGFCGAGTPYVRCRLDNFPDGFGDELAIVVNPGDDAVVVMAPG